MRGVRSSFGRWLVIVALAGAGAALGWGFYAFRPPAGTGRPTAAAADRLVAGRRGGGAAAPGSAPLGGQRSCPIQFRDVTQETGITFVHNHGGSGKRYIMETMSAGLALFDYDGDGLVDIYFLNGAPLLGTKVDRPLRKALYKNLGGFRFRDVTAEAGVGDTGHGLGVTVADYNNDGYPDIYLNNFGRNVLYRNNGDGTFTDVTDQAGLADSGNRVGAGVVFLDFDGDGNLDLFVGHYVKFSYDKHVMRYLGGYPRYPGPRDYVPETNSLYRNNGDGTFTEVTRESGIGNYAGTCMGVIALDFDNDGNTDIFVCNDTRGNFLFRNDGRGKFQDVAVEVGAAYDSYGAAHANMGADAADVRNNGWLSLYVTGYQGEQPAFYENQRGFFADVIVPSGAGAGLAQHVNWGLGFADFDNDGRRDLYVANGHAEDLIEFIDPNAQFCARSSLFRNLGDGKFANVSDQAGDGMLPKAPGRGVGLDDLDNDGRVDVVVLNLGRPPRVLRNESPPGNHWLQVQLAGVKTNRDGVGARVRVVAGDLAQVDEVHSGRGYQSHFGSRLHFGLGKRDRVDRIEVRWTGGGVDLFENLSADRLLTLTEGQGKAAAGGGQ
jgi:hypothetical protein